jgi:hypothetical protein
VERVVGIVAQAVGDLLARSGQPGSHREPQLPAEQDSFPEEIKIRYADGRVRQLTAAAKDALYAALPISGELDDEDEDAPPQTNGTRPALPKPFREPGGRSEFEIDRQRQIIGWLHQNSRPDLLSVMIIGDSIRMRIADSTGYGLHAYRHLIGKANLLHVPHNCGGTSVHRSWLENWLQLRPDIVHINAGLHDLASNLRGASPRPTYNSIDQFAKIFAGSCKQCAITAPEWCSGGSIHRYRRRGTQ